MNVREQKTESENSKNTLNASITFIRALGPEAYRSPRVVVEREQATTRGTHYRPYSFLFFFFFFPFLSILYFLFNRGLPGID